MFLIRIFTGSVVGAVMGVIMLLVGGALLFVIAIGALAATGGPGDCTPGGGTLTIDATHSDAFKQKWASFNDLLNANSPSSVTLTESEISSRADTYLKEKDAPIKHPRACIHDGSAEGQASVSFAGITMKFKVKGTLDLTGARPKAKIDSMEVGNVPGWLLSPARKFVNSAIDTELNKVTLDHHYTAVLKPGQADVGGTP